MGKFAIIASGGGMRCAYGAGVLQALSEIHDITPDMIIGASGSAGTVAYFTAGQTKLLRRLWTKFLSTKKILKVSRIWKILDIDYIVDHIVRKQYPLNIEKFHSSKIECLIPATNYITGKARYFTNDGKTDITAVLKATKALPLLYNRKVWIDNAPYCDSNLSASVYLHVKKAISRGATKLLIIDNSSTSRIHRRLHSIWARLRKRKFKKTYNSHLKALSSYKIPENIDAFRIKADYLPVASISINKFLLAKTFEKGYDEVKESRELKEFLERINQL